MVEAICCETGRRAVILDDALALAQVGADVADRWLWSAVCAPDGALWSVERLARRGEWSSGLARAQEDGRLAAVAQLAADRGKGWRLVLVLLAAGPERDGPRKLADDERRTRRREQARARWARRREARAAGVAEGPAS